MVRSRPKSSCALLVFWAAATAALSTGPGSGAAADGVAWDRLGVEAAPGETVGVTLNLRNEGPRSGVHFALRYDPRLLQLTSSVTTPRSEALSGSSFRVLGDSLLVAVLFDNSGSGTIRPGSAGIVRLSFRVSDEAPSSGRIDLVEAIGADSALQPVPIEFSGALPILVRSRAGATSVKLPEVFSLGQNFPNPVIDWTVIQYELPEPVQLDLRIYDISGRLVRTLVSESRPAGKLSSTWDGLDDERKKVAAGLYFYRISAGSFASQRKLLVVR